VWIFVKVYVSFFFIFRCLLDTDDEVRDRATFYVDVLRHRQKGLNSAYILNGMLSIRLF
jgi:hypothetical protein